MSSNFDDKTCQIKFEHNKKDVKCDFHDILPIEEGESQSIKYINGNAPITISFRSITEKPFVASSDSESDDDDYEQMHRAHLIEKSLLTPAADQPLGEWEKYTKVISTKEKRVENRIIRMIYRASVQK